MSKLPFRPDHPNLLDNFNVCKQRVKSLRNKLEKNRSLFEDYAQVFKDYESDKIIEKVPDEEILSESTHYLPHRGVVDEDRETTKLRVVFDASCSVRGPSLNDCLYSGPNLISKFFIFFCVFV